MLQYTLSSSHVVTTCGLGWGETYCVWCPVALVEPESSWTSLLIIGLHCYALLVVKVLVWTNLELCSLITVNFRVATSIPVLRSLTVVRKFLFNIRAFQGSQFCQSQTRLRVFKDHQCKILHGFLCMMTAYPQAYWTHCLIRPRVSLVPILQRAE
jgi:hypothetical protein